MNLDHSNTPMAIVLLEASTPAESKGKANIFTRMDENSRDHSKMAYARDTESFSTMIKSHTKGTTQMV